MQVSKEFAASVVGVDGQFSSPLTENTQHELRSKFRAVSNIVTACSGYQMARPGRNIWFPQITRHMLISLTITLDVHAVMLQGNVKGRPFCSVEMWHVG
jgi:hypothetical protein